ncbi:MAG TPA: aspartate--ammonia ligase [Cytophagaceae bacterium]
MKEALSDTVSPSPLIFPKNYHSLLDLAQTETAIKKIKDFFETCLATELRLHRVTAPLFVLRGTGINDDLNGTERPVAFPIKDMNEAVAEVVHSLAKWKRMKLADMKTAPHFGLYTDMNAIRPDEVLSNIHSLYVDQWDWEMVINQEDRKVEFLKQIVTKIYSTYKQTEYFIYENYPEIKPILPENITFIHSEDLLKEFPNLSGKEREKAAAKKYGAIFIIGIGNKLSNGEPHDGRAPDYDDWSTEAEDGKVGLNGDIVLWNPVLEIPFEVSSMGIRVSKESLVKQLHLANKTERTKLLFHQMLLNDQLPYTIGGGIGQSRTCMFLLRKAHIGEVQASIWPDKMREACKKNNIYLM